MSDNYLAEQADRYRAQHGKPPDKLVPIGDLVEDYLVSPTPPSSSADMSPYGYFMLAKSYCKGHIDLGADLWTEEVWVVHIPLQPDDPRVVQALARTYAVPAQVIAAALEKERDLVQTIQERYGGADNAT